MKKTISLKPPITNFNLFSIFRLLYFWFDENVRKNNSQFKEKVIPNNEWLIFPRNSNQKETTNQYYSVLLKMYKPSEICRVYVNLYFVESYQVTFSPKFWKILHHEPSRIFLSFEHFMKRILLIEEYSLNIIFIWNGNKCAPYCTYYIFLNLKPRAFGWDRSSGGLFFRPGVSGSGETPPNYYNWHYLI